MKRLILTVLALLALAAPASARNDDNVQAPRGDDAQTDRVQAP